MEPMILLENKVLLVGTNFLRRKPGVAYRAHAFVQEGKALLRKTKCVACNVFLREATYVLCNRINALLRKL